MRAEIIRFPKPKRKRVQPSKPRRRVFYAGYRYVGSALCQDVQQIYLKRHKHDQWSFGDYSEGYPCQSDWCDSSE
jgi:hypothetical protein